MLERKKYSKEYKLDAVSLVTDQGYSRAEAARSLGINANMLCRWVQEEKAGDGQAFRGNGKLTRDQEEPTKPELVHYWCEKSTYSNFLLRFQ